MEPMLRKAVSEELEGRLGRTAAGSHPLRRSPSLRVQAPEPLPVNIPLHLLFPKTLKLPIYTLNEIVSHDNSPVRVILLDPRSDLNIDTVGPLSTFLRFRPMDIRDDHDDSGQFWYRSSFSALLADRWKKAQPNTNAGTELFIDRHPACFDVLLHLLRTGDLIPEGNPEGFALQRSPILRPRGPPPSSCKGESGREFPTALAFDDEPWCLLEKGKAKAKIHASPAGGFLRRPWQHGIYVPRLGYGGASSDMSPQPQQHAAGEERSGNICVMDSLMNMGFLDYRNIPEEQPWPVRWASSENTVAADHDQPQAIHCHEGQLFARTINNVSVFSSGGGVDDLVLKSKVQLTDNSSWIPSRKFRLGVRVIPGSYHGVFRILEAVTEPFVVRDHRGKCKFVQIIHTTFICISI
ncbi:hypothetical protein CRG98_031281 [Punica granatum]|uniref:Calmodulin binding protein-like N-terminal domain-containing protein n=1 Tax=Punica granatum TaxID=22663 RepID=A0A2I0IX50_PUNGR|nr:hypothetical protein CRG98_031281 [Punica granatum]